MNQCELQTRAISGNSNKQVKSRNARTYNDRQAHSSLFHFERTLACRPSMSCRSSAFQLRDEIFRGMVMVLGMDQVLLAEVLETR